MDCLPSQFYGLLGKPTLVDHVFEGEKPFWGGGDSRNANRHFAVRSDAAGNANCREVMPAKASLTKVDAFIAFTWIG